MTHVGQEVLYQLPLRGGGCVARTAFVADVGNEKSVNLHVLMSPDDGVLMSSTMTWCATCLLFVKAARWNNDGAVGTWKEMG